MPTQLSALEARVIGCLIEKQLTTPDQYPLSLNALVAACNQRSNRDPVLDLPDREVQTVVDALQRRQLVLERSGFGSRVPKYQHLFCNTQFGSLQFTPVETAIVCELLLRGPQTPGELRSRAHRLAPVGELAEIEAALESLGTRGDGPYVVRLAREPGKRESRYAQLFTGEPEAHALHVAETDGQIPLPAVGAPSARVALEARVTALETAVEELRGELERLRGT
jgi:uncharacterized protein YceH (UPF0502 family)